MQATGVQGAAGMHCLTTGTAALQWVASSTEEKNWVHITPP